MDKVRTLFPFLGLKVISIQLNCVPRKDLSIFILVNPGAFLHPITVDKNNVSALKLQKKHLSRNLQEMTTRCY